MIRTGIKCRILRRQIHSSNSLLITFEGNTHGVQGTDEERMRNVFGGRIKGEPPKSTSRYIQQGSRDIGGISVPERPTEPDNCCMSGCANCVWEIFNDELRDWKHRRKEAAEQIKGTQVKWPADFDPPLKFLDIQNVPMSLKTKKINLDRQKRRSTASLFPPREGSLPKSVLEAKRRHAQEKQEAKATMADEDSEEGWGDVPMFIKVFAEFEKKKKLEHQKQHQQPPEPKSN
ncbi:LAMI_0E08306g1_1 [Lachancea mirantina]|uniref:LAMI_0E08306g1_1 n=1 Tax=Lachancea mirantina TaxID=1230905 RepID=A0A1G4JMV8_9SACH|nr:LAMI_0E08306g1_1 [Lachancea mirantina]